jgi:hypothetical protein
MRGLTSRRGPSQTSERGGVDSIGATPRKKVAPKKT